MITLLWAIGVLAIFMSILYVASLFTRNNGIADVGYGIAFMVLIGYVEYVSPVPSWQLSLLTLLPFVWGIRLAIRIGRKNFGKPEDFRYKAWRDQWGSSFAVRSFFQIYMLQGLVIYIVALPITVALVNRSAPIMLLFVLGICIWIVGFIFEAIGDRQLDSFISNPINKGKIMMSGLWHYSRHPNYFGESTMWFGLAIAAASMTSWYAFGFLSPILITFLLLKVSGVPLLEKRWQGNPVWETYAKKTSVFIPWIPKN